MKKSFVGLLSAVLAVSALAAPPTFAQQAAATSATVALGFETMAAVSAAYVGSANPIRDIPDGGLPWIISSATGELRADGQLTVSVIWCLRPLTPCRVTCKAPIRRRLSMRLLGRACAPASPSGDADISATVTLPRPCLAPIVFVSRGAGVGSWFAATGVE